MLGPARPDFLAVDDVRIAVAFCSCLERAGVGSARRLGHAERLQAKRALRDLRKPLALLLFAAVAKDRSHRVNLGVASAAIASRALDFFEDGRRGGKRQPRAAIVFGDEDR